MNWHRIKTLAKVLVLGSCLLSFFHTFYHMNQAFQKFAEGETADSVQPQLSRGIEATLLLNSFLVPVFLFGVVLWIVALKKLRRHSVNPRPKFDVNS